MVRESQALVRLPDLAKMQVKVSIHESRVDQLRPGMPARIVIQGQDYSGRILNIANQPQPGSWFSANVKEYATTVSIEGATAGLKPGMTAKVTILVNDLPSVLALPVSSVVEQRGGFFCWVKSPKGPERRPLKLGSTNDKLIEVADGVKEGEEVYRNPRAMIEEARQEQPFEKQTPDTKFPEGAAASEGERAVKDAKAAGGDARGPAASTAAGAPGATAASAKDGPAEAKGGPGAPGAPGDGPRSGEGPRSKDGKRAGGRGSFDFMQFDKNGDKKLSKDELPERMQANFDRMDTNGDGFLDASEIAAMRRQAGGGAGGPGGGARPDGAPGDGGDGGRPRGGKAAGDGGPGGSR